MWGLKTEDDEHRTSNSDREVGHASGSSADSVGSPWAVFGPPSAQLTQLGSPRPSQVPDPESRRLQCDFACRGIRGRETTSKRAKFKSKLFGFLQECYTEQVCSCVQVGLRHHQNPNVLNPIKMLVRTRTPTIHHHLRMAANSNIFNVSCPLDTSGHQGGMIPITRAFVPLCHATVSPGKHSQNGTFNYLDVLKIILMLLETSQ